ncbi:MAG: hypothetical protein HYZ57_00950 [Acidobacteria bacterium]|nr:hypothetical protein [Acidobacteriota bacterium]
MNRRRWLSKTALIFLLAAGAPLLAATFGKVVAIGGHAADLALDEGRGVLYVANFTANRIEVMSLADYTVQRSINVAAQPSGLALSPDGRYLVVVHFSNFAAPATPNNAITVIDLSADSRQTFALGNPPLGVGFGIDNKALIVTTKEIIIFDPASGATSVAGTITEIAAKTLPQPPATFPNTIKSASIGVSGDGQRMYVFGDGITFSYDVNSKSITPGGFVFGGGPVGPRVVSVNHDGSRWMGAWMLIDDRSTFISWLDNTAQSLDIGTSVFDSARGLIYAQVQERGETPQSAPVLKILDTDNLLLRDKIRLPEHFQGRSVLSADGSTMFGVSESGIIVLPVGDLERAARVNAVQEDLVFRGNFCDRAVATQTLTIVDAGGGNTPFTVSTTQAGVRLSPASGVTPAVVRVTVDPGAFANLKGTVAANITIKSQAAVNIPRDVRVLINSREPDQRGSFVNIPGTLADIAADPGHDRLFVLRKSHNDVLVFDTNTMSQVGVLRTGNAPTGMAVTFDRRYLLVANSASWVVGVWDLETLESLPPIRVPMSPHSIAVSSNAILIHGVDHQNKGWLLRADLFSRQAEKFASLGIFENGNLAPDGRLVATPNGSSILYAQPDGTLLLYNANQNTFTVGRKDAAIQGAIAASSFDQFVAGNRLLNASLVPTAQFETATGQTAGFAFSDEGGIRFSAPNASSPGVLQRVNLRNGDSIRPTRTIEAPVLSSTEIPLTHALAILPNRTGLVSLSTSGMTVFPWTYDEAVAPPRLESVVNAADLSQPVAPGGLISVFGQNLSPVTQASRQNPLPTQLGDSCLTVNGVGVPVLFVSPRQINAQLPFQVDGNTTLRLNTPGGVSDNFNLTILAAAPSIFRTGSAGPMTDIPLVIRTRNNDLVTVSNPIHHGDVITILATGLGRTTPSVETGTPAPEDTLTSAIIPPTVTIGGAELEVTFAGLVPGQIGVYQINAIVYGTVPPGMDLPLEIKQGGASTVVSVRVVE